MEHDILQTGCHLCRLTNTVRALQANFAAFGTHLYHLLHTFIRFCIVPIIIITIIIVISIVTAALIIRRSKSLTGFQINKSTTEFICKIISSSYNTTSHNSVTQIHPQLQNSVVASQLTGTQQVHEKWCDWFHLKQYRFNQIPVGLGSSAA